MTCRMLMYYPLCTGTDTCNVHVSSSDCVICNMSSLSGGSWPLDLQWRWLWLSGQQRSAPHCLSSSTPVLQSRAQSGLRGGGLTTNTSTGQKWKSVLDKNSSTPPPQILMLHSSLSSSTIMAFQTASCADDFFFPHLLPFLQHKRWLPRLWGCSTFEMWRAFRSCPGTGRCWSARRGVVGAWRVGATGENEGQVCV